MRAQIAAFCVSAVGGGTMFWRWWRMKEEDRRRVWVLYGWFSGLMCVGSVFGAVTWAFGCRPLLHSSLPTVLASRPLKVSR